MADANEHQLPVNDTNSANEQPPPTSNELQPPNELHALNEPSEHTSLLDQISGDFNDALQEEAPGTSIFQVLSNHPGAAIIAMCLFALLFLCNYALGAFSYESLVALGSEAAVVSVMANHVNHISFSQADLTSQIQIEMNYTQIADSIARTALGTVASKLGIVDIEFPVPIQLFHEGKHFAEANISGTHPVVIRANQPEVYEFNTTLYNLENTGGVIHKWMHSTPLELHVLTTATVYKYGLGVPLPVNITKTVFLKPPEKDALKLRALDVYEDRGISFNAQFELNYPEIQHFLPSNLPQLHWIVEVPGCTGKDKFGGVSTIQPDDKVEGVYGINFTMLVPDLNLKVVESCPDLSKLDLYVNSYLSGAQLPPVTLVYTPQNNSLNLGNLSFPLTLPSADPEDHKVKSVEVNKVRISSSGFTGVAIAHLELPKELNLATKVAYVSQTKGTTKLINSENVYFAEIIATEFLPVSQTALLGNKLDLSIDFQNVPLRILDARAFTEFTSDLAIHGRADVRYDSLVDCKLVTSIGSLPVNQISLQGTTQLQT